MAVTKLRLVTVAWGGRYVDDLLSFCLPALLAPGNLPFLARDYDCEFIIVTSRPFVSRIEAHPLHARLGSLGRVEVRELDPLVVANGTYGLALTHANFQGFADLGESMREYYLLFAFADFILADGSLASLAPRMRAGAPLLMAPSYCAVRERAIPELRPFIDEEETSLAVKHPCPPLLLSPPPCPPSPRPPHLVVRRGLVGNRESRQGRLVCF